MLPLHISKSSGLAFWIYVVLEGLHFFNKRLLWKTEKLVKKRKKKSDFLLYIYMFLTMKDLYFEEEKRKKERKKKIAI
jgi:hypothetical protein